MRERLEARLRKLREEYAEGQQVMAQLQRKQAELQQTLLRIGGAIQVLEELTLEGGADHAAPGAGP